MIHRVPKRRAVKTALPRLYLREPARLLVLQLVVLATGCQGPAIQDSLKEAAEDAPPPAQFEDRHPEIGRWHLVAPGATVTRSSGARFLDRLRSLPYAAGSQPPPLGAGVTLLKRDRVQPGINLYNSGHAAEALAIDLEGQVLHRWQYPINRIWPEKQGPHQSSYWRRVEWLGDGEILAIFEGLGLLRLARDSSLKWAYDASVHHQAVMDHDGTIVTLVRKSEILPKIHPEKPVLHDYLTRLSSEGQLISKISLLEAFESSNYRHFLQNLKAETDLFHTNSIQILDGSFSHRVK